MMYLFLYLMKALAVTGRWQNKIELNNVLEMMVKMNEMKTKLNMEYRLFAVFSFCAFIVYALYVSSFGTNAGNMMSFFQITEGQQGFVITIQSIGGIITAIWLSLFGERYNKIRVIAACLSLLAVGSILIGTMPAWLPGSGGYFMLLIFVILAGVGYTGIDVMMNGAITETYPQDKNTLLPTAHAFFSSGAMIAPFLVTAIVNTSRPSSFALPFLIIGIMTVVVFVAYSAAGRRIMPTTPYADMEGIRKKVTGNPTEIFKSKKAWLILLACVLYFSFQVGLSIWMPTYFLKEKGFSYKLSGIAATIFFMGALLMRFLSPIIFKLMSVNKFYILSGLLSAICMAGAFIAGSIPLIFILVFAGGFFQGAMVIALVIMSCNEFPTRTASASAITVIAYNLAAMVVPLLIGLIAETSGFVIPMFILISCLLCSIFVILLFMRIRDSSRDII